MSTDEKSQLINMISAISESEYNLFITLIKNKQHVGLLEREAEWLSTHHDRSYGCNNPGYCNSCYSGDTICDKRYEWETLMLAIFSKKQYEL